MLAAIALLAAAPVAIPEGTALTEELRAADARFFSLFFDPKCHPAEVRAMLADDVEMYHDKGGLVATSADQFMADYAKACAEWEKPNSWRSRRELVGSSLQVHPVPGFGAIEDGEHRFYERRGDGPERLAGTARLTQVWARTADGWKLKRILSYAHRAAE